MTKLTNAQVSWAVRNVYHQKITAKKAAQALRVSKRRVLQLVGKYRQSGQLPQISKNRRPRTHLTDEQKQWVDAAWQHHHVGNRLLHFVLTAEGKNVPKNKIHEYLVESCRSIPDPRKQGKRKRCRYAHDHSGTMVHSDWHQHPDGVRQVMVIEDDASRFVYTGVERLHATSEATVECTKQAYVVADDWNLALDMHNTDRGSQFFNNHPDGEPVGFQDVLAAHGTKHVPSRPHNPQTNGKNERLWLEYDRHRDRFATLEAFIDWYNSRIHGALRLEWAETPAQAFVRKLPPETLVGLFLRQVGG